MSEVMWGEEYTVFANRLLAGAKTPGAAVGLAQGGVVRFTAGFGYRDREAGLPATADTLFGLASLAKSFTCIAILQLQEDGLLAVSDPLQRYIPEFRTPDPETARQVTLHHLMTHTAGFPDLPFLQRGQAPLVLADPTLPPDSPIRKTAAGLEPIRTMDEHIQALAEFPYQLIGRPGELFNYSNDGYALLGFVIERVTGLPYTEYIRSHILQPAGMSRSVSHPSKLAGRDNVAVLYEQQVREGERTIHRADFWRPAPTFTGAGTSLAASVTDLLRYLDLFRTGGLVGTERILSPESVRAMVTPHVQMPTGEWYGYGLHVTPGYQGGFTLIGHAGGTKGVAAAFYLVPEHELAAVMLSNLNPGPNRQLARGLVNCGLGLPADQPVASFSDYPIEAKGLTVYEGTYASSEGQEEWVCQVEAEGLVARVAGRQYVCRPVGPHQFTIGGPGNEHPLAFLMGKNGLARGLFYGTRYVRRQ